MPKYAFEDVSFVHFETIDSTNTWVKQQAPTLDPKRITCVVANEQTAGRGRFSRAWVSPADQNIYMTLYICLPTPPPYLGNIGQILSLSSVSVLERLGFRPSIKWPNDILLDEKKLGGILIETVPTNGQCGIVIGIGLNVNMPHEWLNTIDRPATSLLESSGKKWPREDLLIDLVKQFLSDMTLLDREGFSPFHPVYEAHLSFKDGALTHKDGARTMTGTYAGIDPEGKLLLRLSSGTIIPVGTGELL